MERAMKPADLEAVHLAAVSALGRNGQQLVAQLELLREQP